MDTKKTRRVVTPNIKILIGFALIILIRHATTYATHISK